jgi:hypothetical protein
MVHGSRPPPPFSQRSSRAYVPAGGTLKPFSGWILPPLSRRVLFLRLEIQRTEDIAPAFEALQRQADALYVVGTFISMIRSDGCAALQRAYGTATDEDFGASGTHKYDS